MPCRLSCSISFPVKRSHASLRRSWNHCLVTNCRTSILNRSKLFQIVYSPRSINNRWASSTKYSIHSKPQVRATKSAVALFPALLDVHMTCIPIEELHKLSQKSNSDTEWFESGRRMRRFFAWYSRGETLSILIATEWFFFLVVEWLPEVHRTIFCRSRRLSATVGLHHYPCRFTPPLNDQNTTTVTRQNIDIA